MHSSLTQQIPSPPEHSSTQTFQNADAARDLRMPPSCTAQSHAKQEQSVVVDRYELGSLNALSRTSTHTTRELFG